MTAGRLCRVVMFRLPPDPEALMLRQRRFLTEPDFWRPYLARLILLGRPLAATRTETPEGGPALALFLEATGPVNLVEQLAREMGEGLEVGAFALFDVPWEAELEAELSTAPRPWDALMEPHASPPL